VFAVDCFFDDGRTNFLVDEPDLIKFARILEKMGKDEFK